MASKEFPSHHVWIYQNTIRKETVSNVYELADFYSKAQNYWIPKEILTSPDNDILLTAAELAIKELYHTVVKVVGTGLEILSFHIYEGARFKVYEGGRGLEFHFDKDEVLYKTEQQTRHPEFSSVLYLTGTDEDRLRQACTVILDQKMDAKSGKTDPESPTSCVFVLPTTGKFCIFDGSLGHGVLDSSNSEKRATLLVNWWTEQPRNIHRPNKAELEQLVLRGGSSSVPQKSIILKTPGLCTGSLTRVQQASYPVIRIPDEDEDIQESGILMDDLLDSYLLDSFGVNAQQAVCVRYSGHVLYPIDPLKTKQDISKSLIIPAAFIPNQVQVGP
eukprot:g1589.t1